MSNALTPPNALASLLRRRLSPERFGPYEGACALDVDLAVALYEWNAQISGAFHEILGLLEVMLRNAVHDQLTVWHSRVGRDGHWYDDPARILEPPRRRDIADAGSRLRRDGKAESPGRIVAELNFGFWRYLLTRRYEATLWTPALRHAFPHLRPARRGDLYVPVNDLVRLRNRIAHHEPIHNRPLATLHGDVLRVARYLDPAVEGWIRARSRVPDLLVRRPASLTAVPGS